MQLFGTIRSLARAHSFLHLNAFHNLTTPLTTPSTATSQQGPGHKRGPLRGRLPGCGAAGEPGADEADAGEGAGRRRVMRGERCMRIVRACGWLVGCWLFGEGGRPRRGRATTRVLPGDNSVRFMCGAKAFEVNP